MAGGKAAFGPGAFARAKTAPVEVLERDGFVLQLYDLGYTYGRIPEELARRFGGRPVTRQAIQQRVARLWLAARGQPFRAFRKR